MRDQAFTQRFHDRDAVAGRGRFEFQRDIVFFGERGERGAVAREQRLVGGDDMLAVRQRIPHQRMRHAVPATDEFDDHIGIGLGERDRIVAPRDGGKIGGAALLAIARGDGDEFELAPRARSDSSPPRSASNRATPPPTVPRPAMAIRRGFIL